MATKDKMACKYYSTLEISVRDRRSTEVNTTNVRVMTSTQRCKVGKKSKWGYTPFAPEASREQSIRPSLELLISLFN